MIRKVGNIFILMLLLYGCEKSEVSINLKSTLKGHISPYDVHGAREEQKDNILVFLDGSEPELTALTDTAGNYEINNIPTGTYNLVISKEGYGENQYQGLQLVGGSDPVRFNSSIYKKPDVLVNNLSLDVISGTEIYVEGDVDLGNTQDVQTYRIEYFIHNESNPSKNNYEMTQSDAFFIADGTHFRTRLQTSNILFSSGKKIFVIAYSFNPSDWGYYDLLSGSRVITSLGAGSNVASTTIP
jgi:hypothetical protein